LGVEIVPEARTTGQARVSRLSAIAPGSSDCSRARPQSHPSQSRHDVREEHEDEHSDDHDQLRALKPLIELHQAHPFASNIPRVRNRTRLFRLFMSAIWPRTS